MVLLFGLSVLAIILAVNVVFGIVYIASSEDPRVTGFTHVPTDLYIGFGTITFLIILVVSLVNVVRLAGGGAKVAKMLGARLVAPNTTDRLERRLLNIVEEMSIASGVRLPQVYVMDEEKGINAFAAGWTV